MSKLSCMQSINVSCECKMCWSCAQRKRGKLCVNTTLKCIEFACCVIIMPIIPYEYDNEIHSIFLRFCYYVLDFYFLFFTKIS